MFAGIFENLADICFIHRIQRCINTVKNIDRSLIYYKDHTYWWKYVYVLMPSKIGLHVLLKYIFGNQVLKVLNFYAIKLENFTTLIILFRVALKISHIISSLNM